MNPFYGDQTFIFEKTLQKEAIAKLSEVIGILTEYLLELPTLYDTDLVAISVREISLVFGLDEEEVLERILNAFPDSGFRRAPKAPDLDAFEIKARKDIEDIGKIMKNLNNQDCFGSKRKYGSKRTHFKSSKR